VTFALLGRSHVSHMTGDAGEVEIPKGIKALWNDERIQDDVYCRRALMIAAEAQRREQLLNFGPISNHPSAANPRHVSSKLAAMYLRKGLRARSIPPEYSRASPRDCVVEAGGRVYGFRNLFIRSSAVFATSGYANPTLTILALAVRFTAYFEGFAEREAVETGAEHAG
jgi:hypothetical protein